MGNYLLLHGTIVTVDRERRIIEDGGLAIQDDRIVDIGPAGELASRHPGKQIIDCRGKLIIPGLIDAHGHAGHALIRSIAADTNAMWMKVVTPTYYHYVTRDYWYADGLVSGIERLRAGVTTGASIITSMPRADDPLFAINHARAYEEIGLREIICVGPSGLPWPHPVTRWESGSPERRHISFEEMIEGSEATIEALNGTADGRISVFLTPFTIVPSVEPSNASTPDQSVKLTENDRMQARRIRETARKTGVRLHSDAFAGQIRMAFQDKENALLGPDIHLQHCWGISHDEIDILAETGTRVTHAPPGRATPIMEMMSKGIRVAITTDGAAPSRHFDMLQTARLAQFTQHLLHNHDRYLLPPGKIFEMITIDAAHAIGMENEIGSLEIGKKADVVVIDMRKPHLMPMWMPVHRLVHQVLGSDVDTVFVDGRMLMENGRVLTTDVDAALNFGQEEALALAARAGLEAHMHDPGWGRLLRTFEEPVHPPQPPEPALSR
ncbi:amidohydrolase family protein [Agrobacterium sp. 22-211-1]|uniref:amidohydrolase family protein n=1 Tax=Rhizobium/Agrobacterium group TaxID=227290 RepID=UPI0006997785|nr:MULTISPECIES: amidohydrolase family protein [Rhizobium/Agrobacterium group]KNY31656.1 hydrolase [Agrobacterium sp. SUL3]MCA2375665.1 amidohydrolase family protein [Agrobacterium tomkonis RTP8]MCD4658429.1 amidohydrolase family protein [Agrobacterium sp.]MCZ7454756.1 amidohydrolase family protein [Rhizobium rhizogenes]